MARQITNDVIGPLIAYNFGVKGAVPRFQFGPLSQENDQAALAAFQQIMAAQNANVPKEFYDELISRVAAILNLDPGKVAKDIEVNGSPQMTSLELLQAQVDQAHAAVKSAQMGNEMMAQGGTVDPNGSPTAAKRGDDKKPTVSAPSAGRGASTTNGQIRPTTVGTRPFGATSQVNPGRDSNKKYGN
jgi:hypothetical protein